MYIVRVTAVRNCAHLIAMLEGANTRKLGAAREATYSVQDHYASFGCLDEVSAGLFQRRTMVHRGVADA